MPENFAVESGFILTRHSQDIYLNDALCSRIVYWASTPYGPAKLVVDGEQTVFFILTQAMSYAQPILAEFAGFYHAKPLALKTFDQAPCTAIYTHSIKHFHALKSALADANIVCFEDDIFLHHRYLMERFIKGSFQFTGYPTQRSGYIEYAEVKLREDKTPVPYHPIFSVLSLDIECSGAGELFSVGLAGYTQNTVTQTYQTVIMIGEENTHIHAENVKQYHYIHWVKNENALLYKLCEYINAYDPDILIGWNVVDFDFQLLFKRAALHSIAFKIGRGGSVAQWKPLRNDTQKGFVTIPGRVVIDGIDALKSATYHFESFSLEFVAQTLLNKGKKAKDVHNRLAEIEYNFAHDKLSLAAYNLEDCDLVLEIFEQTNLIEFMTFRSHLTGLELDKIGGSVAAFTNLYLPKLHRAGYIAPNLPEGGGLASPGGYVMNSIPGLYKNVLVLDFKSLYPSIIRTFKIDPLGLIEGLLQPDDAIEGFKEAYFSRDKHFLPDIITELWAQRDVAKKHNNAPLSQAIKIIMNSFYGVLGSGGCRFYDTRLASSITLRGQAIMQQTAQWIESHGYEGLPLKVIYGDTDSTFVSLPDTISSDSAKQLGRQLTEDINQRWQALLKDEMALECYLELEFETHFHRFLMPTIRGSEVGSKKRYAGLTYKYDTQGKQVDHMVFKGLEAVRTDWTALARDFQTQLYACIFHDEDPQALIKKIIADTLSGQLDDKFVYRKRLRQRLDAYVKNVPPHVRAARIADEHNASLGRALQYQNKGWISYVITQQGPQPIEYQTAPLDYAHYIEKQIEPVADAILPFVGLSFEAIASQQITLF